MKNKCTLLTAFLLISFTAANAQFTTGKYLLGGDLNFQTEGEKGIQHNDETANVNFKLGKLIKENTVVGLNLSYKHTSTENGVNLSNQYGAGIFYRKYKSLSKNFHLLGEADLNYEHGEYKNNIAGSIINKVITNGISISLMPGLSYTLTNKIQIELLMPDLVGIGYSHAQTKINRSGVTGLPGGKNNVTFLTNLDKNVLSNFGVGFKFLLGK